MNPFVGRLVEGCQTGRLQALYGPFLEGMRGHWRGYFKGENAPENLFVEIGCHKGLVISQMAQDCLNSGFVGLDITFKRVVETAERAQRLGLSNLVSVMANGRGLDLLFQEAEVDGFMVFFPDPWAKKKRQLKNRLLNKAFVESMKSRLKLGGFFWFKTDHKGYFDEVSEICTKLDLQPSFLNDVPKLWHKDYVTTFQKGFMDKGLPTYSGLWVKG